MSFVDVFHLDMLPEERLTCQYPVEHYSTSPHYLELVTSEGSSSFIRESAHLQSAFRDRWIPYLEAASARGEIRPDLETEDVITWLSLLNTAMLCMQEYFDHDMDRLRDYYRTFVIPSLVS
jgi:hypothetical protein